MNCENCGLPEWAVKDEGVTLTVTRKAENKFQKSGKRTVWCCREECAIQTEAISKYGPASSKWPMTLAQFRAARRKTQRTA